MSLKDGNVSPSLPELDRLSDELQFEDIVVTTDATPDTEGAVAHNIGSIPKGYSVIKQDKAGSIYLGTTAWTDENIYVRSEIASVTATLRVWK